MGSSVTNAQDKLSQQQTNKMAGSRVPMTLRDFFFDDPFFKSTWDDFEKVRENMFRESRDMWKRFEDEFSQMESSMSSNMLQSSNMSKDMLQSSSNMSSNMLQSSGQSMESSSNKKTVESESKEDDSIVGWSGGWMMPRRWMMPSM